MEGDGCVGCLCPLCPLSHRYSRPGQLDKKPLLKGPGRKPTGCVCVCARARARARTRMRTTSVGDTDPCRQPATDPKLGMGQGGKTFHFCDDEDDGEDDGDGCQHLLNTHTQFHTYIRYHVI